MRKSTIIASCLVNAGMVLSLVEGERTVERVFASEYPTENYARWNTNVADGPAGTIIADVNQTPRISVYRLIKDLWEA